jgi:Tol biopolymer transport system component
MADEKWQKVREVFDAALRQKPVDRRDYIKRACGDDRSLLTEVESLFSSFDESDKFLEMPAVAHLADVIDSDTKTLKSGTRVGHHEIIRQIGAGGMGQVYLAQDKKLDRRVAIKILNEQISRSESSLKRFVREAKAASALNHPNILVIHEIGESAGLHYIVSEFIEGRTLREVLGEKTLTVSEVLELSIQVASALSAAHGAHLVHRDIKPENLMVRPDGYVKILDFGLAKLIGLQGKSFLGLEESTVQKNPTAEGVILGTVNYMSPEQAKGRDIDERSDIFSLGVVIYEMTAGRTPFAADSVSETLANLLNLEPPSLSRFADSVPEELQRVVSKLLRKNKDERYQLMKDVLIDLKALKENLRSKSTDSVGGETATSALPAIRATAGATKRQTLRVPLAALISLIVLLAIGGGLFWWYSRPTAREAMARPLPLTSFPGLEINPTISPDGNQVAFTWNGEKQDNFDIYVKLIGSNARLQLTQTPAEDFSPAWSPDGRNIAFLRWLDGDRNELMLISPLGGPERKLTETVIPQGSRLRALAWSPDGRWLAVAHHEAGDQAQGLFLVSAQTGEKRRLTRPPAPLRDFWPAFSPDGRMLAFMRFSSLGTTAEMYLLSFSTEFQPSGEARQLKTGERFVRSPVWTPDGRHILYLAAPHVGPREQTELRMLAVSGAAKSEQVAQLEGEINGLSLGRHLVYTRSTSETDIFRAEIPPPGSPPNHPQLFISSTRHDYEPRCSPDGKKIAFRSTRSGAEEIWLADADGSNPVQLTSFGGPLVGVTSWSPDSQRLVFMARDDKQADIFTIPATGGVPKRLTNDPADDVAPCYSHDGRWIYFNSGRSGQHEIWKMPAGGGEAVKLTSIGGAHMPFESPDGKTLFFMHGSPDKSVWKIPITGGEAVQVTEPVNYYGYAVGREGIFYSPAPDTGQKGSLRFLSFATGQTRTVVVTERPISEIGLGLSPDERFLLFGQRSQLDSDLMLIENFAAWLMELK